MTIAPNAAPENIATTAPLLRAEERPHQRLGNELIAPDSASRGLGPVRCRERLGGALKFYYRRAA
jgi:hypothetical protein